MKTIELAVSPGPALAVPPTDEEKYNYLAGPQHRWFWWAHFIAFCGIAYSLYGFARMTYWTLIFLLPLFVYGCETVLGLWTSTFKRRFSLTDHLAVVELWDSTHAPSVDVYITTCGEGVRILENTFHYVAQLAYPGVCTVYVLDDAGDPEVRASAADFGFEYIARPSSAFKKAGNLQYAFERTHGDYIMILDADFVPRSDALTELIPHMEADPRVGILQSNQYYDSHSPRLGWIERCASATQELFYRFIQPSRDAVEATICCGTSALYRRKALDCSGGFPQIPHSEDMFTGFDLIQHGYRTAFIPVNVTQGLCPSEIDPFISQQYRWCVGSISLLAMSKFHLHPELTLKQRACYWSGFFYYLTTAMNVLFAPIPLLIMVWRFPYYVSPSNMIPLIGIVLLWLVVYPVLLVGHWRLEVLRVQTIYGFAHAIAFYDVIFGTEAEWVPSNGKNRATPLAVRVKRLMGGWLGLGMLAIAIGVVWRLQQEPFTLEKWWALLAFMAINVYVFVPVVWKSLSTLYIDSRPQKPAPLELTGASS